MKKVTTYPLLFLTLFLSACSVSKQINHDAHKYLLKNPSFVNAHTGISIYEPATGKFWYNHQAEKYFVPASNTKLATCFAAMKYLGDSLIGIKYHVVNDSTILIKGAADPSFLDSDYHIQPVYHFLKDFHLIQIIQPIFTDFFGNGWAWDDYKEDYMAQRSSFPIYGNLVKINWKNSKTLSFHPSFFKERSEIKGTLSKGFDVQKSFDKNQFTFQDGMDTTAHIPFTPDEITIANLLQDTLHQRVEAVSNYSGEPDKIVYSQPTDSVLKPMMHRSDNFFAEQSLLMVSNILLGKMNDQRIIDTLLKTDFKSLPQKPRWVDGSGLSRYNLFSPKDFVFILNEMKNEFGMKRIKNILPTGGTGTINSYYRADSGYIFAKTGSLSGVIALSGFLYTKKNKLLLFSILVNNHHSQTTAVRKEIEKFIQQVRERN